MQHEGSGDRRGGRDGEGNGLIASSCFGAFSTADKSTQSA
jgi:hypothetical protein